MPFSCVRAIAFDLDGTLIDSAPELAAAVNAMLHELGQAPFPEQQIRGWIGNGMQVLIQRALSGSFAISEQLTEHQVEQGLACFGEHYYDLMGGHNSLYQGVLESLQALQAAGFPLALITNKAERFTLPLLQRLGLDRFFAEIICGDSLAEKKPSPLPLLECARRFKIPAAALLMVGDSKNDILAAKAAGCPCVGLTYGYNYGEDIALSEPQLVCEQLPAILPPLGLEFVY